jgi:hypothetical protein
MLNLTPNQLDDFTPREFENKLVGFEKLERQRNINEWEQFRLLAATLLTPHTKKGKGIKPENLWRFEWDKKAVQAPKMTKERLAYLQERSKRLNKNG